MKQLLSVRNRLKPLNFPNLATVLFLAGTPSYEHLVSNNQIDIYNRVVFDSDFYT